VKLVKATADYSNPEKDLEPEFDDKSGTKRTYGPVRFAIDGKANTAWGIDAGPVGATSRARRFSFRINRSRSQMARFSFSNSIRATRLE